MKTNMQHRHGIVGLFLFAATAVTGFNCGAGTEGVDSPPEPGQMKITHRPIKPEDNLPEGRRHINNLPDDTSTESEADATPSKDLAGDACGKSYALWNPETRCCYGEGTCNHPKCSYMIGLRKMTLSPANCNVCEGSPSEQNPNTQPRGMGPCSSKYERENNCCFLSVAKDPKDPKGPPVR